MATVFSSVADLSHDATPEMKGQMQSLVAGCQWTGLTAGPFLGGLMMQLLGPRKVFLGVMAIYCLGLFWALLFYRETLRPENKQQFRWRTTNVISSIRSVPRGVGWCTGVRVVDVFLPRIPLCAWFPHPCAELWERLPSR